MMKIECMEYNMIKKRFNFQTWHAGIGVFFRASYTPSLKFLDFQLYCIWESTKKTSISSWRKKKVVFERVLKIIFIFLKKIRRYGINDEKKAFSTSNMTCRYWYLDLGLHILLLLSPWISYYIVYERILIKHHYLHDENKMHGI